MLRLKSISRSFSAYTLLNEEQLALKDAVQQFVDEKVKPDAYQVDKDDYADLRKYFRALGELGMMGVTAPEEYGGSDLGYLEHCIISEEITRGSAAIGASYVVSTNLCINQLVLNGTHEQKKKYLPKLCEGEHIGALAMSEPNAGSDVMSMKMKATKTDGGWLLNGVKMWITNGPVADVIIVYAKSNPAEKSKGITTFIVEGDAKGFSIAQKLDKMGIRGSPTGELLFEDVFVPDENVLGEVDKGAYVLMSGLNSERLVAAAGPVGIMQACLDECGPYAAQRKQFGAPIGSFQLIQEKLANMYTDLNASRAYVYTNAIQADKKEGSNADYASVFLMTAKSATQQALEAMQIFGGNGYINDYPLGRFVRDAKVYEIYAGTAEIRQLIIARELMQKYS